MNLDNEPFKQSEMRRHIWDDVGNLEVKTRILKRHVQNPYQDVNFNMLDVKSDVIRLRDQLQTIEDQLEEYLRMCSEDRSEG